MPADHYDTHYIYSSPSVEDFKDFSNWINILLTEFAEYSGISRDSILTNKALLIEIHNRVDQRRAYFLSYHSDKERATIMTQYKNIAIICYWLTKYKPLFQDCETMETLFIKEFCTINEMFALYLIKTFVLGAKDEYEHLIDFFTDENNFVILYNFMHRDISKEAFIMFVSSLVNNMEL